MNLSPNSLRRAANSGFGINPKKSRSGRRGLGGRSSRNSNACCTGITNTPRRRVNEIRTNREQKARRLLRKDIAKWPSAISLVWQVDGPAFPFLVRLSSKHTISACLAGVLTVDTHYRNNVQRRI